MSVLLAELYPEFSGLAAIFDEDYYTSTYPDVRDFGIPPFLHYCLYGRAEGRRPSEVSPTEEPASSRSDVVSSGLRTEPTNTFGKPVEARGSEAVAVSGSELTNDSSQIFSPSEAARALFDGAYYESQLSSDVVDGDLFRHFCETGWKSGLDPNFSFSVGYYLGQHKDVAAAGLNPLLHYVESGEKEGRQPHPGFDPAFYLASNDDVKRGEVGALAHYITYGSREGRRPHASFHPTEYAERVGLGESSVADIFEAYLKLEKHTAAKSSSAKRAGPVPLVRFLQLEDWASLAERTGFKAHDLHQRQSRYSSDAVLTNLRQTTDVLHSKNVDSEFVQRILDASKGKVLSLDIWDTVLRRSCYPDETKLRSARVLWLTDLNRNARLNHIHPVDLFNVRRMAEAKLANEDGEYTLPQVVEEWVRLLGLPESTTRKLLDHELAIESSSISADATALEIISAHQGPVIGVSDFYMSGTQLETLLHDQGVSGIGKVYSSSDHGVSKRSGRLFTVVQNGENILPDEIVHVGDNEIADYEMPRANGIAAHLYSPADHEHHRALEHSRFWSHVDGDNVSHSVALLAHIGVDKSADMKKLPLAAMAIPLCGFVTRVMETALRGDISQISFFSREGIFFKEVYDRLVQEDVFDLVQYPESEVLNVSRRATFAPSMRRFSIAELMRMWSLYSTQSIRTLMMSLNLSVDGFKPMAVRHGLDVDDEIKHPWLDPRVIAFMHDLDVVRIAQSDMWQQRKELENYLDTTRFARSSPQAKLIVDIGWRGTIQDNLANLSLGKVAGVYLGLDRFLNRQPRNSVKEGYLFDRNESDDFEVREYAALEFLCNGQGGSVRTYLNGEPVKDLIESEEVFFEQNIRPLQRKLLDAVSKVANYVRLHGLIAADIRSLSREIVSSYMDQPPDEVALAFSKLIHNESFGAGMVDDMKKSAFAGAFRERGAKFHGLLRSAGQGARWLAAHLKAPELFELKQKLSPGDALNLPAEFASYKGLTNRAGKRAKIAIYAPEPIRGSGGHRTIYNIAKHLSELGGDVHLLSERPGSPEAQRWMSEVIPDDAVTKHYGWASSDEADVAIATIDYSARYLRDRLKGRVPTLYLIQDYEAQFNPVGDVYLSSQLSYALCDYHFTVGSWLGHVMHRDYGVKAASGGLGIDGEVYRRDAGIEKRRQIAFLYQPEKPRRAANISIQALRLVRDRVPDVKIVSYGSSTPPPADSLSVEHRGLIDDLGKLNDLYNQSTVGLCISGTNPSRVPFEMMAAGCVPVDLYRYNNLFDYESGSAVLALQSPDSIADAICKLLTEPSYCSRRAEAGIDYVRHRTVRWECDVAANAIRMILSGSNFNDIKPPKVAYSEAPIVARSSDTEAMRRFLSTQREMALE